MKTPREHGWLEAVESTHHGLDPTQLIDYTHSFSQHEEVLGKRQHLTEPGMGWTRRVSVYFIQ